MIDGSLKGPWPEDVRLALELFKQGDLIEQPPFLYAGDLSRPLYALTEQTALAEVEAGEEVVSGALLVCEALPESCPPYGIITTGTCDLAEQGEPEQPWLQVAPVYRPEMSVAEPQLSREQLRSLTRRAYLVELDGPLFVDEFWVADLRLEVPVEKSALVGRTPIPAFGSEESALAFADRIGQRRARAALSDVLDRAIVKTLRRKLERRSPSAELARSWTYQVRVRIVEGQRLAPVAVKVYLVLRGPRQLQPGDDRDQVPDGVIELYERWWDNASTTATASGLRLLPNEYLDSGRVDAELYDKLIELDLSHLR